MSVKLSSAPRSTGRQGLRDKRRHARRRLVYVIAFLLLLMLAAAVYGLQQSSVRVSHISVFGASDAGQTSLTSITESALQGRFLGIVPRDSIFFYPEDRIRKAILEAHGDIATVSIFRSGLTGLSMKVVHRVPIARWCPEPLAKAVSTSTPSEPSYEACVLFDDSGLLFATTSEVPLVNPFIVYTALSTSTSNVRGQVVPQAELLPAIFNFARELGTFGSPVASITIADAQATLELTSATRVQYVIGREQDAYTALVSGKNKLNLADSSLDYVDLRFPGKLYIKKKSATVAE